jgi:ABC-type branched-subunit amino acid transport system substrate-binding protein
MKPVFRKLLPALFCLLSVGAAEAAAKKSLPSPVAPQPGAETRANALEIAYLSQARERPPAPFFMPRPDDQGMQGARLGALDNNTTGRFTGQSYALKEIVLGADEEVAAAFKQLVAEGRRHILVDLPAASVAALAKLPDAAGVLIYNIGADDDRLRAEDCSDNLLHLAPSRAMRADALAQYLAKKRWREIFLAVGPEESDALYAAAFRRAAKRFGLDIAIEKTWTHRFDDRRTPEAEIPVFTQGADGTRQDGGLSGMIGRIKSLFSQGADYDILAVADEAGTFGDLFAYRSWRPRPVAGTQGLVPSAWHYAHEQWGALQLQNRFRKQAGRWMTELDYAAWLALRAIGEAATRAGSTDFERIKAFMLSEDFALAGFKGVPLSFRAWDGQMRQPMLLASARSLVAVAPIEGFLHPRNELDTLGFDRADNRCRRQK